MSLSDTTPEAQRVLIEVQRRIPFARRWQQMGDLYRTAKALHAMGDRDRHPDATPEEIAEDWRSNALAGLTYHKGKGTALLNPNENLEVVREVIGILERLNVVYALGGSWASSMHGEHRFSYDAVVCVDPFVGWEKEFVALVPEGYYVSLAAVEDATLRKSCFNLIHGDSGFKVDLFVRKDRPFELMALSRRRRVTLGESSGLTVYVFAPEDVILFKLEWYRLGGEVSEKQWNDILGVMKIQAERLDLAYLEQWATQLAVNDLLHRARQESGL